MLYFYNPILVLLLFQIFDISTCQETDNINGVYAVKKGFHYSNKTSASWGNNGQSVFSVNVSMSETCATYNCSSSCSDEIWYYDYNKLWGKARYARLQTI